MKKMRNGFTLIELLVVVLIIGILAAVALPQYQKAVTKSQLYSLVPIVHSLRLAQENYYLEHGQYADSLAELDVSYPQSNDITFSVLRNGPKFLAVQALYKKEIFGYRETLSHAKLAWNLQTNTGFCIEYSALRHNKCTQLGIPSTFENWYQDWHQMD